MKNFGRFTYYGNLGGYSHVWSTTDPPIYGARILLNETGNTYVALRGEEHPEPTAEEIAEARALVKPAVHLFGRFKYYRHQKGYRHVWATENPPTRGVQLHLKEDGTVAYTCPAAVTAEGSEPTEAEITEARAKIGIGEAQVSQSEWDFGRFKYIGAFEIRNNLIPIKSEHTWSTAERQGAQIGLRGNGSLCFTSEANGHPTPNAFEIMKAQALVKHKLVDASSKTTSLDRFPRDFGRFKYCGKVDEAEHAWATPDKPLWRHKEGLLYGAWILINTDGSLRNSSATGREVKAPTKEEIDIARNMVLSENLVKQVEEGERPVIRSTAFYKNSTEAWNSTSQDSPSTTCSGVPKGPHL